METRRGKGRVGRLQIGITIFLLIIAVAVVLLTLFQIRKTAVIGNERYSSNEILADLMYDFPTHNSLYLGWKYRTPKFEERAPYLSNVQVKITAPGEVQVIVREKPLSGYVQYNGQNVFYDSDGIVLEISDNVYDGVVLTEGMAMQEPELYKKLPVENTAQLRTVLSVNKLLEEYGLTVRSVSFDDNQNVTAWLDNIEVLLGQDEYMEEKISNLAAIYKLQEGETGVLNMSAYTGKNEPITFSNPSDRTPVDTAGTEAAGDAQVEEAGSGEENPQETVEETPQDQQVTGIAGFMVFDSSGTLRYDARVIGGQVVDASGNPIPGCSVNEKGHVIDAYWNEIDPMTGTLAVQ